MEVIQERLVAVLKNEGYTYVPESCAPCFFNKEARAALSVVLNLNPQDLKFFSKTVIEKVESFIAEVLSGKYSFLPDDPFTIIAYAMGIDPDRIRYLYESEGVAINATDDLSSEDCDDLIVELYERIVPEIVNQELYLVA